MSDHHSTKMLLTGAAINTVINAIINGGITWFKIKEHGPMPITQNAIAGAETSALADAVPTALLLAAIFTAIGYFTLKLPNKPPYFPKVLLLTLKHVFLVLGVLVTAGVLFQRGFGSVIVSAGSAAVIIGLVAGLTAGAIDFLTKRTLLDTYK